MYLINASDIEALAYLAESLDLLDQTNHLDLGKIDLLNLSELTQARSLSWEVGEPIVYQPEEGVMLLQISHEMLNWLNTQSDDFFQQYQIDRQGLRDFLDLSAGQMLFILELN